MSKEAEKLIKDGWTLEPGIRFLNPFTGKTEPYLSDSQTQARMFEAAAQRINDLEEQISAIKAFLVL